MSVAPSPTKRIDVLLGTLLGERHFVRPLLDEVIELLVAANAPPDALRAVRRLVDDLGHLDELRLEERVLELMAMVRATASRPLRLIRGGAGTLSPRGALRPRLRLAR